MPAEVDACDRLAADPDDKDRPAAIPGVTNDLDAKTAILVCGEAVKAFDGAGAARDPVTARRVMYEYGRALSADDQDKEANSWFTRAANAGSIEAMVTLGDNYAGGTGVAQDYAAARGWYDKAVTAGSFVAMDDIGDMYFNGYGVPVDFAAARGWYEKAAAGGNGTAMASLGDIYLHGKGVAKNEVAARLWFDKAYAADPSFAFTVALIYLGDDDFASARLWLERDASTGDTIAMNLLGNMYANGTGVQQDYVAARGWYEKAAAAGDDDAMVALGDFYANGQGVPRNVVAARAWYQKALEKGSDDAKAKIAALPAQ